MFSRIKDSIDRGIVSVSVKSSTYLGVEKLKTKAENVSAEIGNAAAEMGAAVYEQWKAGAVSMEYVENVCGQETGRRNPRVSEADSGVGAGKTEDFRRRRARKSCLCLRLPERGWSQILHPMWEAIGVNRDWSYVKDGFWG